MSKKKDKEWTKEDAMRYLIEQIGTDKILRWTTEAMQSQLPDARDRLITALTELIEQLGPEEVEARLRARREAA